MNKKYKTAKQAKRAKQQTTNKFNKEIMVCVSVRFRKDTDKQVLDRLNAVPNKTDYIRQLILADLNK